MALQDASPASWGGVRAATASTPLPTPPSTAPTAANQTDGAAAITENPMPRAALAVAIRIDGASALHLANTALPRTVPAPHADSNAPYAPDPPCNEWRTKTISTGIEMVKNSTPAA